MPWSGYNISRGSGETVALRRTTHTNSPTVCIAEVAMGPDHTHSATAKPKGYLRLHPVPERLFDGVTSDFFYLGDLEGEECQLTKEKVNGMFLIQCRHSGYIHALPCNVNAMTGKAAAKWCAQTWMGCWDDTSQILTDAGSAYTSDWCKTIRARLGFHHLRCEVHQHRALWAE